MSGLACVARGRRKKGMERGREKSTKEGKGKGASPFPSLPFFPIPLPLSTSATQAMSGPERPWGWLYSIYDVSLAQLKPPLGFFFCKQTTWRLWA